jgi:hypothetical protein
MAPPDADVHERWIVAGRSMTPTLDLGDRVQLRIGREFGTGDVVLFASDDPATFVLHRVVLRVPAARYFIHAGDAARGTRGVGFARVDRVVGVADLARRRAHPARYLGALRCLARYVARGGRW